MRRGAEAGVAGLVDRADVDAVAARQSATQFLRVDARHAEGQQLRREWTVGWRGKGDSREAREAVAKLAAERPIMLLDPVDADRLDVIDRGTEAVEARNIGYAGRV